MVKNRLFKPHNKNTIRSSSSSTFNEDDYLNDLLDDDDPDKSTSKTTDSILDDRIRRKSNKVIRNKNETRSGKPLQQSRSMDVHRAKTDGRASTSAAASSNHRGKQLPVPDHKMLGPVASPVQMHCDKIELNAYMRTDQMKWAVESAQQLVRDKVLVKITTKSRFHRHLFKLPFVGGAVAVFRMAPINANVKAQVQLVFNPNPSHMTKQDARSMIEVWKRLFGLNATEIARTMLFHRVDICADFPEAIDNLIIDLDGVRVGSRFGIKTRNGAKMQTFYLGGPESAHHGTAYDQDASDEYKANVGEVASRRTSLRQDADIVLEDQKGRVRIESRRLFDKAASLAELGKITDIFGGYKVWSVQPRAGVRMTPEFVHYLDCVRLRGINGARRWTTDNTADKKAAQALVASHEKTLQRLAADWWRPADFNATLLSVLRSSPAWRFLSVMDGRQTG